MSLIRYQNHLMSTGEWDYFKKKGAWFNGKFIPEDIANSANTIIETEMKAMG